MSHQQEASWGPKGNGSGHLQASGSTAVHSPVLLALRPQYPPPLLSSDLNSYFFLQSHFLHLPINTHIVENCPSGPRGLCSPSGKLCFSVQTGDSIDCYQEMDLEGCCVVRNSKAEGATTALHRGPEWAEVINGHMGWAGLHSRSDNLSKTSCWMIIAKNNHLY